MEKVLLSKLKLDLFKRSTLIGVPNLDDLLSVNDVVKPNEIFFELIKNALLDYEHWQPLTLTQKTYLDPDTLSRQVTLVSNMEAYLEGIVTESQLNLVPNSIVKIGYGNFMGSANGYRRFDYNNPPYLKEFWLSAGTYQLVGVFSYPIIEKYTDESKTEFHDQSAIYHMRYNAGQIYKKFYDLCFLTILRYVVTMKMNLNITGLPIDIFSGIEAEVQRLGSELDSYFTNSTSSGQLLK
jgi:hypothetical protein